MASVNLKDGKMSSKKVTKKVSKKRDAPLGRGVVPEAQVKKRKIPTTSVKSPGMKSPNNTVNLSGMGSNQTRVIHMLAAAPLGRLSMKEMKSHAFLPKDVQEPTLAKILKHVADFKAGGGGKYVLRSSFYAEVRLFNINHACTQITHIDFFRSGSR